jgi:hypothetical protein
MIPLIMTIILFYFTNLYVTLAYAISQILIYLFEDSSDQFFEYAVNLDKTFYDCINSELHQNMRRDYREALEFRLNFLIILNILYFVIIWLVERLIVLIHLYGGYCIIDAIGTAFLFGKI